MTVGGGGSGGGDNGPTNPPPNNTATVGLVTWRPVEIHKLLTWIVQSTPARRRAAHRRGDARWPTDGTGRVDGRGERRR